ncbi:MAG: alpha/beta hydrolase [Solirubrobacteraceae bacterium]
MREVEFQSGGETVRGDLYLPDSGDGPFPVVVMAGGWCYVKELRQPHYARRFNEAGFATLVFDYRRLGASEGEPRQHLDPWAQIEDYRRAISYVSTLPEVDRSRIATWGISYSGGHSLIVAALDRRVKAAISVVAVVDGYENMRRVHGRDGFRALRAAIEADRARRDEGEPGEYIPMSVPDHGQTVCTWPFPEVNTIFEKLKAEEAPRHEHRNTIESVELLLQYSVFPYVRRLLDTPVLMIVTDDDDLTLWDKEIEVFNLIPTSRKRLAVIGGTDHMSIYSKLSDLDVAAMLGADWIGQELGAVRKREPVEASS